MTDSFLTAEMVETAAGPIGIAMHGDRKPGAACDPCKGLATAALSAALPAIQPMLADAWDKGYEAGMDDGDDVPREANPYRGGDHG